MGFEGGVSYREGSGKIISFLTFTSVQYHPLLSPPSDSAYSFDETVIVHFLIKCCRNSMGKGKMIVEFFSAEMVFKVCRYLSCKAEGDWSMTSEASFKARAERCSPSAAIT